MSVWPAFQRLTKMTLPTMTGLLVAASAAPAMADSVVGAPPPADVVYTGRTLARGEIRVVVAKTRWVAERGVGLGGGVLPLALCTIVGTAGDDKITGTPGDDVICGLGGNDTIDGAGGSDIEDGGNGTDRLRGSAGADVLIGAAGRDRLDGGSGADLLGGGAAADRLAGGAGADRLDGGHGRDVMVGGPGQDLLSRVNGRDRIVLDKRDRVTDGKGNAQGLGDAVTVEHF